MYLHCNKKTLSRLSEMSLRYISRDIFEYQTPSEQDLSVDDISKFIRKSKNSYYLFLCPYCKYAGIFWTSPRKAINPYICAVCGETDPFYKTDACLEKVRILKDMIVKFQEQSENNNNFDKKNRILQEQCIVLLASGLEIFLRDVYSILLNVRYVKTRKTLYKKFYLESKNEFINIGKAMKKYSKDLAIDLKNKLDDNEKTSINILLNKRHLIVHNNGLVDTVFNNQTGLKLKIRDPVPIDTTEIENNIDYIKRIMKIIGFYYKRDVGQEVIHRISKAYVENI